MKKVLVTAPYFQPVVHEFAARFAEHGLVPVVPAVRERLNEAELLEVIGDISGVIAGDDQFTRRVLEAAPKLKVLSKWGTGIDSFDQEACRELGVVIRNTRNAFSEPVGDTVLGAMLVFARNLLSLDRAMKQGQWMKIVSRTLAECTVCIVGVGDTGTAVARRAAALGARLVGNDIREIDPAIIAETCITMLPLEECLPQADFVCMHTDLNPTSRHLMNAARFALMRPEAYFINAARGPVVDEKALVAALQEKRIAGAALDVFEDEPLPQDSPLRRMDNVLLSPHNANSSPKAWARIHELTFNNLLEELEKD